jgi:hypothetical protein
MSSIPPTILINGIKLKFRRNDAVNYIDAGQHEENQRHQKHQPEKMSKHL